MIRRKWLIAFILIFHFVFILGETKSNSVNKKNTVKKKYATWYGGKFHGRKTNSGEVYDMYSMTAAHRTLPFGTYVKVTNVKNNESVIVKINDRGPWQKKFEIDLSYAAFSKIKDKDNKVMEVKLDIVSKEDYENQERMLKNVENKANLVGENSEAITTTSTAVDIVIND